MFYQQAKHLGWRRYDQHVAIVDAINNQLQVLAGPPAALWESLAEPTSLEAAAKHFSELVKRQVAAPILRKALMPLVAKGLLIEGDTRAGLTAAREQPATGRGYYIDDLFSGFYHQIQPYVYENQLLKADIEINAACNLRCVHCYISDYKDRDLMSFQEICGLLDELAEIGVMFLNLTGGEMTLRRDFLDIIAAARARHFVVSILSNATRLGDATLAELGRVPPGNVYVSLYGVSAATHEHITDRPGTFDATLRNVRRLRALGIPVVLRYLIMRHNVADLALLPDFADELDCLYTTSSTLFVTDGPKEFLGEHRITDDQRAELWAAGLLKPPAKGLCTAGKQRVRIDAKGNVYPCELLRMQLGNLRQANLVDIMSTQASLRHIDDIHSLPKTCSSCAKNQDCPRCPGLAYHEDGNVLQNSSLACQVTDAYQRTSAPELVQLRVSR